MVCIPRKNITSDERLGDLLDKCIRNHPDNDAIVYVDRDIRLSWREWGIEVDRVAKGMMAMGVQKGEKVAVWATNVPDWITLMFATAKIGAIMLTINTNYRSATSSGSPTWRTCSSSTASGTWTTSRRCTTWSRS